MISFFIRLAISAAALLFIANYSGGQIKVTGTVPALEAALLLGLANAIVKPLLYAVAKSATCLLSCLTLGLWSLALSWLINGFLFWIVAANLDGFDVKGFWPACWGALALAVVNALATVFFSDNRNETEQR